MPSSPDIARATADWQALSDSQIVARVVAGETALFELLMRRYNQRLFRALRAVLKNHADAEDALQECYIRAFRELHSFRGQASVSSWLMRIGVNLAIDRRRRQARVVSLEPEALEIEMDRSPALSPATPEDANVSRELRELLEGAIDGLPLAYRTVFVLREVEGLGVRETAESLGIEEATVRTRLHRARRRLRDRLYDRAGATAADVFEFGGATCDRVVAHVLPRLSMQKSRANSGGERVSSQGDRSGRGRDRPFQKRLQGLGIPASRPHSSVGPEKSSTERTRPQ